MSAPSVPTLGELVTAYLERPDSQGLARLRSTVVSSTTFDPDLSLTADVGPLLAAGEHDRVVELVTAKMPGAALSPVAHRFLAIALRELGHAEAAGREQAMAELSVSSVLSTGDGTRESPWSVLRVSDQYDVMGASGMRPVGQTSLEIDGRLLDRLESADGREVWFVLDRPRVLDGA